MRCAAFIYRAERVHDVICKSDPALAPAAHKVNLVLYLWIAVLITGHFSLGAPLIRYVGSLTKRGTVPPGGRIEMTAKASTSSPGVFELSGWELVAEAGLERDGRWIEQARYVETDAGEPLDVEVVASPEPMLI